MDFMQNAMGWKKWLWKKIYKHIKTFEPMTKKKVLKGLTLWRHPYPPTVTQEMKLKPKDCECKDFSEVSFFGESAFATLPSLSLCVSPLLSALISNISTAAVVKEKRGAAAAAMDIHMFSAKLTKCSSRY